MDDKPKVVHMTEIPCYQIPDMKYAIAMDAGVKDILMTTWGGLGDQVCGEPALRYAFGLFPGYRISLLSSFPELFDHLPFHKVFTPDDAKWLKNQEDKWMTIHTNPSHHNMARNFVLHHYTQCVDFSSLCAFQRQLPIKDRQINVVGPAVPEAKPIVIHPGRHWPSKTFPKSWYDQTIGLLIEAYGAENICIIGKDIKADTGTVDVDVQGCTDLRNKLTLKQLITVCKEAKIVITNDSAPLHLASAGAAHIFFVSSCKQGEHLMHWRFGHWAWRMYDLGQDGLWNHQDSCPIRKTALTIENMDDDLMYKVLPYPAMFVAAVQKKVGFDWKL